MVWKQQYFPYTMRSLKNVIFNWFWYKRERERKRNLW